MVYKIFDENDLFCIKCNKNKICTGKYNYSLGGFNMHYCSPILSIPIIKIIDKKYTNPLNLIFELYFSSVTRICDDIRCKNGIISHINTIYYNNFDFPTFLIF